MSEPRPPLARRLGSAAEMAALAAELVEQCEVRHPRTKVLTAGVLGGLMRNVERELIEISIEAARA